MGIRLWNCPCKVHYVEHVASDTDMTIGYSAGRLSPDAMVAFLAGSRRFVAVHRVELDHHDVVTDARLCAWNQRYAELRCEPVHRDQSMLATYVDGAAAVECVRIAWEEGLVHQVFEFSSNTTGAYRQTASPVAIDVLWRRVDDYVVEVGTELGVLGAGLCHSGLHAAGVCTTSSRAKAAVRQEIGEDLHDSIIQQLFASVLRLNATAAHTADEQAADTLRLVARSLSGAITELRQLIAGLHAPVPVSVRADLEEAVGYIVESSGVRCTVSVCDDVESAGVASGDDLHAALHMTARELVSNAVRHGEAANVEIRLDIEEGNLVLTVIDDGIGCSGSESAGNGLANLHRRAGRLGGSVVLRSAPGGGTTVVWQVPLPVRENVT